MGLRPHRAKLVPAVIINSVFVSNAVFVGNFLLLLLSSSTKNAKGLSFNFNGEVYNSVLIAPCFKEKLKS